MSGIVGIINFDRSPVDRAVLQNMTDSLAYRGPDAQEIWIDGHAGLGHTLFRVTHEAINERQPLTFDDQVVIVMDGRMDIRDEVIPLLRAHGCDFPSDTPDVNLVLHAYNTFGEDCLRYLQGDFAFAIWDKRLQKLFCARDHFGLRVFYYARIGSTIIFSNEIRAVRQHPMVLDTFNDTAITDFLLLGRNTWLQKDQTPFADIFRLPPAHRLVATAQHFRVENYWEFPLDSPMLDYSSEEDYLEHYRETLRRAIADRTRSHHVNVLMSGGLDSSTIAAIIQELNQTGRANTQMHIFTTVYDRIHPDEERYYAALVAKSLDNPITFFEGDAYCIETPGYGYYEPYEDYTPALTHTLFRQLADCGRVVLMGSAGDNVFWPSNTGLFNAIRKTGMVKAMAGYMSLGHYFGSRPDIGTGLVSYLRRQQQSPKETYGYPVWLNKETEARLGLPDRWERWWNWDPAPLHERHPASHKWTVAPNWYKFPEIVDAPAYAPVEFADPYLDLRIVTFALALPSLPWFYRKYLQRRAMENRLPEEVVKRPKSALGALLSSLLKQSDVDQIDRWKPIPELEPYIDYQAVPKLKENMHDIAATYVNMRPILLNNWMRAVLGK